MKITIAAELPDGDLHLLELFVQHIRDFDVIHKGCHFAITAVTNLTVEEMERALSYVTPPFPHRATHRKQ